MGSAPAIGLRVCDLPRRARLSRRDAAAYRTFCVAP